MLLDGASCGFDKQYISILLSNFTLPFHISSGSELLVIVRFLANKQLAPSSTTWKITDLNVWSILYIFNKTCAIHPVSNEHRNQVIRVQVNRNRCNRIAPLAKRGCYITNSKETPSTHANKRVGAGGGAEPPLCRQSQTIFFYHNFSSSEQESQAWRYCL